MVCISLIFPAHQVGEQAELSIGYGFSQAWVITGSTAHITAFLGKARSKPLLHQAVDLSAIK